MKILGLDLGTNSIGWAVVEKEEDSYHLIDKGVRIFQEGVKIEKGVESSKAAERTSYRSARRLKFRRKLRKIETLSILAKYGYCPQISDSDLRDWRYLKVYPKNDEFRRWLKTDDKEQKTPYYFRNLAATRQLDLTLVSDRYKIGRAFYHIAQRRGFLSNRLESTKENEGIVKRSIEEINREKGDKTLGQFFYEKYLAGEKIRDTYTHRKSHYKSEFDKICDLQGIPDELRRRLEKAIFYQRPLKSQKGLVAKCVFEKNKPRCPVSRPEFEEFRMLAFVNNIKIKTPEDERLRFLTQEEKESVMPLFYRKSKEHFDFEDLAKKLTPKGRYGFLRDKPKAQHDFLFNYSMRTSVSGCPVSARLKEIFGEDFLNFQRMQSNGGVIDIQDVWHVLFSFDSNDKLREFALGKLQLNEEQTEELLKIRPRHDYASLSLKAINKILPYLREGLIYSHAVFLANMHKCLPDDTWKSEENRNIIKKEIQEIIRTQNEEKDIIDLVNGMIKSCRENEEFWSEEAAIAFRDDLRLKISKYFGEKQFSSFSEEKQDRIEENAFQLFKTQMQKNLGKGAFIPVKRIDERIREFLIDNFNADDEQLNSMYHPAAMEVYQTPFRGKDEKLYLNSPLVSSIRNPMAMRALHQLRKIINKLIREDIIDQQTSIHVEMSRGLLNANERKGLQDWQRAREEVRKNYADKIKEHFQQIGATAEPSHDEVLKYQLWEEQNHKCMYTGEEIALSDFLGSNPSYDIEHTIPRSLSFDDSQANKTLCNARYNRTVKRNRIPSELPDFDDISHRIEMWKENHIGPLEKQIQQAVRQAKGAMEKSAKDNAIRKRHRLTYEKNYWKVKYERFLTKEIPQGFKNSQIVDTGIISKYARLYLKTMFDRVYTVKGNIVADFRRMWGIQEEYERKERINHIHHCIDAVTIACITKDNYEMMARFYHDWEDYFVAKKEHKPTVEKPWPTFTEDLKEVEKEVLVSHYTADVLPKQSKKKLRKRGKIQYNSAGQPTYLQGDTVRASLHKETFYGAIKRELTDRKGQQEEVIRYVVRKPLDGLEDANVKNIVDDRVREIVMNARKEEKNLRKKIDGLKKQLQKAEETEETNLQAEIEAIQQQIVKLYSLPNKNGDPVPIKKVRIYTPTITNPIKLKKHRDTSQKRSAEHKEYYHVANDGNYAMGIYEGLDAKGKMKRDFTIVNNLEAGEYLKLSVQKDLKPQGIDALEGLIPSTKMNGKLEFRLKGILKIGTMIILWQDSPDEVYELSVKEIERRLYKVVGLSEQVIQNKYQYATIVLRHHKEARQTVDLRIQDGAFRANEDPKPYRKLNHNQFDALIEGFDFKLNPLGKIEFAN